MIKLLAALLLLASPALAADALVQGPEVWKLWRESRTPSEMYELLGYWKIESIVRSDSSAPVLNAETILISWYADERRGIVKASNGQIGYAAHGSVTLDGAQCRITENWRMICARYVAEGARESDVERALSGRRTPGLVDKHHLLTVYRRPYQF